MIDHEYMYLSTRPEWEVYDGQDETDYEDVTQPPVKKRACNIRVVVYYNIRLYWHTIAMSCKLKLISLSS